MLIRNLIPIGIPICNSVIVFTSKTFWMRFLLANIGAGTSESEEACEIYTNSVRISQETPSSLERPGS
jgi:hypothetical protein